MVINIMTINSSYCSYFPIFKTHFYYPHNNKRYILSHILCFKTGSLYAPQVGLKVGILLLQAPTAEITGLCDTTANHYNLNSPWGKAGLKLQYLMAARTPDPPDSTCQVHTAASLAASTLIRSE